MKLIHLFVLLTSLVCFTGCKTNTFVVNGVPNFRVVDAKRHVYRGGQPTAEGWKYLQSLDATNVVKLNLDSEGKDPVGEPFHVYRSPINVPQQLGFWPINQPVLASTLTSCSSNMYIHCLHGHDRTGLFTGLWRMRYSGWSKKQAQTEMYADGFHKSLFGLWYYWLVKVD